MVRLLMFNALTSKWDNPAAEGQESFKEREREKTQLQLFYFSHSNKSGINVLQPGPGETFPGNLAILLVLFMWFIYFFFLFVSNDDDEKRPCNMPCLPSVIVTRKDHCWVLLQSLIDTVHLHTKLWFGFRTLVVEVTTADEKRKNDLQPCSRKLQRVPLLVPLLDQKITRVKIDFFIFFGQHSEEAPAENSSCRISSN